MRKKILIVIIICYCFVLCSCQELLDGLNDLVPTTQPKDTESNKITQTLTPSPTPTLEDELNKLNEQDGDNLEIIEFKDIKAGDVIEFGKYNQDDNGKNGKEPIEWIVLCVEDDRALLFSKYVISSRRLVDIDTVDCFPWHKCSLRKWLNEDFYDSAFDQIEKNTVLRTIINTPANPILQENGEGYDTIDKVFLLTIQDLCNPDYGFDPDYKNEDLNRLGIATKTALYKMDERGKKEEKKKTYVYYWLRTTGKHVSENGYHKYYTYTRGSGVTYNGKFFVGEDYHTFLGVRPALYIKLTNSDDVNEE